MHPLHVGIRPNLGKTSVLNEAIHFHAFCNFNTTDLKVHIANSKGLLTASNMPAKQKV